ncbi:MAG TPA: hypothetical protein VJX70_00670 [Candidatus Acidoferrum sp.]|nr:hypothetical protein [Candidatus Acidoferrum sp.]
MPEIRLLPLARVALQVASAVLPPYRTRFSKYRFTQAGGRQVETSKGFWVLFQAGF